MTLYEKLLEIQKRVDSAVNGGKNGSCGYASDENVLGMFRPMLAELGLLIPRMERAELHEGTARFMTGVWFTMLWHDVESGEELAIPWYAQGVDLAGGKGAGKAAAHAEKHFLLKLFHAPAWNGGPDADRHAGAGKNAQQSAAAKKSAAYYRKAIPQMLQELCGGDREKIKAACRCCTRAEARGYAGVDGIGEIKDAALPVVYGKAQKAYEKQLGHSFCCCLWAGCPQALGQKWRWLRWGTPPDSAGRLRSRCTCSRLTENG